MSNIEMTSQKPYLIPALYEWILDNNCTPYITVNVQYPNVKVPPKFLSEISLVLNLAPNAISNFYNDGSSFSFNARFSGASHNIYIPFGAIDAIIAKETGQGMIFMQEQTNQNPEDNNPPPKPQPPKPSKTTNKNDLLK